MKRHELLNLSGLKPKTLDALLVDIGFQNLVGVDDVPDDLANQIVEQARLRNASPTPTEPKAAVAGQQAEGTVAQAQELNAQLAAAAKARMEQLLHQSAANGAHQGALAAVIHQASYLAALQESMDFFFVQQQHQTEQAMSAAFNENPLNQLLAAHGLPLSQELLASSYRGVEGASNQQKRLLPQDWMNSGENLPS